MFETFLLFCRDHVSPGVLRAEINRQAHLPAISSEVRLSLLGVSVSAPLSSRLTSISFKPRKSSAGIASTEHEDSVEVAPVYEPLASDLLHQVESIERPPDAKINQSL